MRLKFDADLQYQHQAIDAVVDLFEGLPPKQSEFEISFTRAEGELFSELGVANQALLDADFLLKNLSSVQERNVVPKSSGLIEAGDSYVFPNFSVEMETGTGKTYVYLRTIFELNRRYGLKKFIVVVPSVAIREGVLSSINLMREHFKGLYDNVPFDHYVYSSSDLAKVRQFAVSNEIQILIINIQAFQKDAGDIDDPAKLSDEELKKLSVIHREQDKMSGRRPIEFVQAGPDPSSSSTSLRAWTIQPTPGAPLRHLSPCFACGIQPPISIPITCFTASTLSALTICDSSSR